MTQSVYVLVTYLSEQSDAQTDSKITREKTLVPQLIFRLEQSEHFILRLAKAHKVLVWCGTPVRTGMD